MGAKWIRSQQWDDAFFPRWAWPAKFVLRAFSSIWLAVVLLSIVSLFGILASVPIGMLAAIPSWGVYVASFLIVLVVVCGGLDWIGRRVARGAGAGRAGTFLIRFAAIGAGIAVAWALWYAFAWPALRWDPVSRTGVRFFADFCEQYRGTVLRRLPGLEMSELEFYSWWPLRVVLILFVLNMVVTTVRRIDFEFKKIGVLTVHTGIVVIALGSVYYATLKQEGDTLILAGQPDEQGTPTPGPPVMGFFDNTEVALWLAQLGGSGRGEWEQRSLAGLPRYNDYALDAAGPAIRAESRRDLDKGRTLGLTPTARSARPLIDDDIAVRIVGYCTYGELRPTWVDRTGEPGAAQGRTPARHVELLTSLPMGNDAKAAAGAERSIGDFILSPVLPGARVGMLRGVVSVEYLEGAKPEYWNLLQTKLPPGARHGLVVSVPGSGVRQVVAIEPEQTIDVPGGWRVSVKELHPEPPLSVITPGFEGATSPVAIVRVEKPAVEGAPAVAFDRYVYARFPELNQDLLDSTEPDGTRGMPKRRASDDSIRIEYVDASVLSVVIDGGADGKGAARAILRQPGRDATVIESLKPGESLQLVPMVSLRVGERYDGAERIEAPWPVPERDRDRQMIGNHRMALIAVEVSTPAKDGKPAFKTVEWVPHNAYHPTQPREDAVRAVQLPDGRRIGLAFGRRYHRFPGFAVQLRDFEMTPYPHSTQPKDFKSDLLVIHDPTGPSRREETRSTSLNNPLLLRVPFRGNPDAPALANYAGWLVSWVAPNQFKLSQTGWDASGWNATKAAADRGEAPRPVARFTILGVGNNPGIYVIAAGGVMMAVGTLWAFYVKPWLVRREKRRIQAALAAGTWPVPGKARHAGAVGGPNDRGSAVVADVRDGARGVGEPAGSNA